MSRILINDRLTARDNLTLTFPSHKKTFRTKIMVGRDKWVDKKTGITYLGEVWDETENETVLGGSIYTLSKLFNDESPITLTPLENLMGLPGGNTIPLTDGYPHEHHVSLFGVGIGGAGDSYASRYPVEFKSRELAQMIPIRLTSDELTDIEKAQYWMKKEIPSTATEVARTAYYLKELSSHSIKALWKDTEEYSNGSEIDDNVYTSTNTNGIEVFEECVLDITEKDVKEYFEYNGNIEESRINEIGLFSGIKQTLGDGSVDYKYINLFSACHIDNNMLQYSNDLTFIYRIYTN